MRVKVHHECFDDPWVIERSRAMNAEIDASPEQDHPAVWAIFKRHRAAAETADPERVEKYRSWLDEGLKRAALLGHPTHGRWGLLEVEEWPTGLEARLEPARQRQRREFDEALAIPDIPERVAALRAQATRHDAERRAIIEQWYTEKYARADGGVTMSNDDAAPACTHGDDESVHAKHSEQRKDA